MDINKQLKLPKIRNWIVKYDDEFQMPQFIQGKIIDNNIKSMNGKQVMLKNIESIDFKDKIVTTYNGEQYKLIGVGKRMILIGENEILEIAFSEMNDILDD